MFNQLLPQCIDNTYRGQKLALWLFALLVFTKVAMSLNAIFNGYAVATSADGIPLDTFPPAAAQAVVSLFAIWGLAHLVIGALSSLALVRYRSIIPFLFALLLLEQVSRRAILYFMPIVKTGTSPGFYINLALTALIIVGLVLSLWRRDNLQAQG